MKRVIKTFFFFKTLSLLTSLTTIHDVISGFGLIKSNNARLSVSIKFKSLLSDYKTALFVLPFHVETHLHTNM